MHDRFKLIPTSHDAQAKVNHVHHYEAHFTIGWFGQWA